MATDQMIHINAEKETHIDITSKYLNFNSRVYIVMLTSDAPVYELTFSKLCQLAKIITAILVCGPLAMVT